MPPLTKDEVIERLKNAQPRIPPFWRKEIGDVDFSGHCFQHQVDFRGAIFGGVADFERATFRGVAIFDVSIFSDKANFQGADFQKGASFFDSTFEGNADFSWSQFRDKAYFWRAHFRGQQATFKQMIVRPLDEPPSDEPQGFLYPGETNFSWALFSGQTDQANFCRAHFYGKAYFWRTVFCAGADFSESKFAAADFEGTEHKVCIARRDFAREQLFDDLLQKRIITLDPETEGYNDYAHFVGITDREELRHRLGSENLQQSDIKNVEEVWNSYAKPMFSGTESVSFEHASFQTPNHTRFLGVNLERCLFLGSNVGEVKFANVHWDKRKTFLLFGERCAIHDECHIRSRELYNVVGNLYHALGLRAACNEIGLYGIMEG